MPPDLSPERLAAVRVDPDLVLTVIEDIAAVAMSRSRRKNPDLVVVCAAAYAGFAGIDAPPGVDATSDHDLQVIGALVTRMAALSDLVERGHLEPGGPSSPEAMAEAASAARLVMVDGRTGFQLLDFLAQLERANGAPRR